MLGFVGYNFLVLVFHFFIISCSVWIVNESFVYGGISNMSFPRSRIFFFLILYLKNQKKVKRKLRVFHRYQLSRQLYVVKHYQISINLFSVSVFRESIETLQWAWSGRRNGTSGKWAHWFLSFAQYSSTVHWFSFFFFIFFCHII